MTVHVITTDTLRAEDLGRYVATDWTDTSGLCGAWSVAFGPVTQVLFLQELLGDAQPAGSPLPPLPVGDVQPQRRDRDIVRAFSPHRPAPEHIKVLELRTYDARPGQEDRFIELMTGALPLRQSYSPNYGAWTSLTGRLGRVRHLWGYRSLVERDEVRGRLKEDGDWGRYTATILPMLEVLNSTILHPLPRA
jgi:hypothetical protein